MKFVVLTENEYVNYYNSFEKPFFWQSPCMAHFEKNKGWNVQYVGVKDANNQILAATTLLSKHIFLKLNLFKALRGFLIDYNNQSLLEFFLEEIKNYLMKQQCLYFEIDPYVEYQNHEKDGSLSQEPNARKDLLAIFEKHGFEHLGFREGNNNNYEPRIMLVLNLDGKTEQQVLKEMDSQTRQNINNTLKTGIKVVELDVSEYEKIHEIVSATGERRNFANPDLNYYIKFKEAFKDQMTVLYAYLDTKDYEERYLQELNELEVEQAHVEYLIEETDSPKNRKKLENVYQRITAARKRLAEASDLQDVYGEEIALGAAMFVTTPYEIVYLFSGSYKEFNRFKGAYAIQWAMIRKAIKEHVKRYNFYGVSGVFNESAEDYGVFLFKKGFNADVKELIGNFKCIVNKDAYKLYTKLKEVKVKIKH